MSQLRFSIRTLLMLFAVVAMYFPFRNAYEAWRRDRLAETNYHYLDCENLCAISEGASVESVTQIFPSLIEVEPNTLLHQNLGFPKFDSKDKIYRYSFTQYSSCHDEGFGFFHFRDGRLASHPAAFFSDPAAMMLARGGKLPTAFKRSSVVPMYLYLSSVVLIFTIYVLSRRLVRMVLRLSNSASKFTPDHARTSDNNGLQTKPSISRFD